MYSSTPPMTVYNHKHNNTFLTEGDVVTGNCRSTCYVTNRHYSYRTPLYIMYKLQGPPHCPYRCVSLLNGDECVDECPDGAQFHIEVIPDTSISARVCDGM